MESNTGWIKLHRNIMDSPDWLAEPFTRAQAWIDLLLLANHKPGFIRKRGIMVAVDRGQVGYSEEALACRWQWSRGKTRRFLSELVRLSQISHRISEKTVQKNASVSSLIHIVNYDKHQMNGTEDRTENGRKTVQEQRMKRMKRTYSPPNGGSPEQEILILSERYDQNLLSRTFQSLSSTRKTGSIAPGVRLKILQAWEKYPVDHVQGCMQVYLQKDYAAQGKDEKYLLGIIRRQQQAPQQGDQTAANQGPHDHLPPTMRKLMQEGYRVVE